MSGGGSSALGLLRLVAQNLRRNKKNFIFSSFGIVVGISTFVFFMGLGQGIKTVVLEEIFIINQIEVVPRSYDIGAFRSEGGLFGGPALDDAMVEELSGLEGVSGVYPKMRLTFPARAWGGQELLGRDFYTELIADGIPPGLVTSDLKYPESFQDFEQGVIACTTGDQCPSGRECTGQSAAGKVCEKIACEPPKVDRRGRPKGEGDCPSGSYCAVDTAHCEKPIPLIVNPRLLEIYNGSVHTAMKGTKGALSRVPKLSESALLGVQIFGQMGRSYLGESAQGDAITRKFELVGFSDKAIGIGVTMPISYVKRFNAEFKGEDASNTYHSILVETARNDVVAQVARHITEVMGFALDEKYEDAQRAGLVITIITLIFSLISVIIIVIAAVNIMHTFLMIIVERRRELGVMRAVGATRAAIAGLVLMEAAVVGLVGGAFGSLGGWLVAKGIDKIFAEGLFGYKIPDFPFKPETLFAWEPWFFAMGVGGAVLFCLLGALVPALRAANMDPAAALTGQ